MKKKEILIKQINQFLLDNEVETVYLTEVGRNFETSTGEEEGQIEIIGVRANEFIYFPAGHSEEEFEEYFEAISTEDLEEILDGLNDWKVDRDKTMEKTRN